MTICRVGTRKLVSCFSTFIGRDAQRLCTTLCFFFSSRRRHTRLQGDWSSDVCSSDLGGYSYFAPAGGPECGRREFFAHLGPGVTSSLFHSLRDELGTDIAFAKRLLIHRT